MKRGAVSEAVCTRASDETKTNQVKVSTVPGGSPPNTPSSYVDDPDTQTPRPRPKVDVISMHLFLVIPDVRSVSLP
jgi:hypothetical protein